MLFGKKEKSIGADEEKRKMGEKLALLERENYELRERIKRVELEYVERIENVKRREVELENKIKEVNLSLKEVYALKEALNEHRIKIGRLENEKEDISRKFADSMRALGEQKKIFENEKTELKEETKRVLLKIKEEGDKAIRTLQEENKTLRNEIAQMKAKGLDLL